MVGASVSVRHRSHNTRTHGYSIPRCTVTSRAQHESSPIFFISLRGHTIRSPRWNAFYRRRIATAIDQRQHGRRFEPEVGVVPTNALAHVSARQKNSTVAVAATAVTTPSCGGITTTLSDATNTHQAERGAPKPTTARQLAKPKVVRERLIVLAVRCNHLAADSQTAQRKQRLGLCPFTSGLLTKAFAASR